MVLRIFCFFPFDLIAIPTMYVILFLLLGSSMPQRSWVKMAGALPVESVCKNSITTLTNKAIFEINSDIYDLKNIWDLCRHANSAPNGRSTDSQTIMVCQSIQYNLEYLCNHNINEENSNAIKQVWKKSYDKNSICQGNYIFR